MKSNGQGNGWGREPGEPDFREVLAAHREDYLTYYGQIRVLGLADECVPREAYQERVYRSVRQLEQEELQRLAQEPRKGPDLRCPKRREVVTTHERKLLQVISKPASRTLLIGDGGNGKTEFTCNLAYCLAKGLQPARSTDSVPLRVELNDLQLTEDDHPGARLYDSLINSLRKRSGCLGEGSAGHTVFDALMSVGRLVLILDGLDELPVECRSQFDLALSGAVRHGPLRECALVLSGRSGICSECIRSLVTLAFHYEPAPLTDCQIHRYVHAHLESRGVGGAAELVSAIRIASPTVRELLSRPLMIALTCFRWEQGNFDLPQSPTVLMEASLDALLRRRFMDPTEAFDALGRLAITSAPRFETLSYSDACGAVPSAVLDELARRSGLLVGDHLRGYRFTIKPLAEYLAGRSLAREEGFPRSLARRAGDPAWTQPLALAVAYAVDVSPDRSNVRSHVTEFVDSLLDNDHPLDKSLYSQLRQAATCANQARRLPGALIDRLMVRLAEAIMKVHSIPVTKALSEALSALYWHEPSTATINSIAALTSHQCEDVIAAAVNVLATRTPRSTEALTALKEIERGRLFDRTSVPALSLGLSLGAFSEKGHDRKLARAIIDDPELIFRIPSEQHAELLQRLLEMLSLETSYSTYEEVIFERNINALDVAEAIAATGRFAEVAQALVKRCATSYSRMDHANIVDEYALLRDLYMVPEVRPVLKAFLRSKDRNESTVAAEVLLSLDPPDTEAIEVLWKRLEHAKYIRELLRLGATLLRIPSHGNRAMTRVCEQLSHADSSVVINILEWLSEHDLPKVPVKEVSPLLNHDDPFVRLAAARLMLSWNCEDQAVSTLTQLLESLEELKGNAHGEDVHDELGHELRIDRFPANETAQTLVPHIARPDVREAFRRSVANSGTNPFARAAMAKALLTSGDRTESVIEVAEQIIRNGRHQLGHDVTYFFPLGQLASLGEALADAGFAEVAASALVDATQRFRAERDARRDSSPPFLPAVLPAAPPDDIAPPTVTYDPPEKRWNGPAHALAATIVGVRFDDRIWSPKLIRCNADSELLEVATFFYARGLQMDFADELVIECHSLCIDEFFWHKLMDVLKHVPRRNAIVNVLYDDLLRNEHHAAGSAKILCQWGLRSEAVQLLREEASKPENCDRAVYDSFLALVVTREAVAEAVATARESRQLAHRFGAAQWLELNGHREAAAAAYLQFIDDSWVTSRGADAARRLRDLGLAGCARSVLEFLCAKRARHEIAEAGAWLEEASLTGRQEAVPIQIARLLAEAITPQGTDDLKTALYRELVTQRLWDIQPNCSTPDAPVTLESNQPDQAIPADRMARQKEVLPLLERLSRLVPEARSGLSSANHWQERAKALCRRFAVLGSDSSTHRICVQLCIRLRLLKDRPCKDWREICSELSTHEDLWEAVGDDQSVDRASSAIQIVADWVKEKLARDGTDSFDHAVRTFLKTAGLADDAHFDALHDLNLNFKRRGRASRQRRRDGRP